MTQKSSLHGHGMMNSRLFSVSVISPVFDLIRYTVPDLVAGGAEPGFASNIEKQ
jgi:hypothetical protein